MNNDMPNQALVAFCLEHVQHSVWMTDLGTKDLKKFISLYRFMPAVGSVEYCFLWTELIKLSKDSLRLVYDPTNEMIALHKALWEL